jgi:hypothetical protein
MEYENVTPKVLLLIEPVLQHAEHLQHARLSLYVRCPNANEFLNPDNNLESHCIINFSNCRSNKTFVYALFSVCKRGWGGQFFIFSS